MSAPSRSTTGPAGAPPGAGPEWLSELQARFGAVLRTPLDRSSGTLRAQTSEYADALGGAVLPGPTLPPAERLAIYNRQYWCRLFGVLQNEYPLTARLFGFWQFNEHAARFLAARAPAGQDIQDAADGFDEHLAATLPHSRAESEMASRAPSTSPAALVPPAAPGSPAAPRRALLEAAAIDAAWRRVHAAPDEPHFRPSPEDAARIGDCHLRPRSGWTVIDESWPLVELRRTLAVTPGEGAARLPPALAAPQSWVLFRAPGGAAQLALLPRQAELFRLLARHRVADALARLESAAPPGERAQLPANVRVWLAQSVELGFWRGMDDSQVGLAPRG